MLDPHLPKCLHLGERAQAIGCTGGEDRRKQAHPIPPWLRVTLDEIDAAERERESEILVPV